MSRVLDQGSHWKPRSSADRRHLIRRGAGGTPQRGLPAGRPERIITSAHRNQGSIPDRSPCDTVSDFYFVQADDPEAAVPRIIELVKSRIPKRFSLDPIRDIQVLCPMNCGGVGARSLNIELQAALNPAGDRKVERFGWTSAPATR